MSAGRAPNYPVRLLNSVTGFTPFLFPARIYEIAFCYYTDTILLRLVVIELQVCKGIIEESASNVVIYEVASKI